MRGEMGSALDEAERALVAAVQPWAAQHGGWAAMGYTERAYESRGWCVLEDAVTREAVGRAHGGKSAEQVALRWITQSGASFAVATSSATHFADDLALFDWQLDEEDMARLEAINKQPAFAAINKRDQRKSLG